MPFKKIDRLQERLKQRDFKLKTLLEVTRSINENRSTEELLEQYRVILAEELNIKRLILFTRINDQWSSPLKYGIDKTFNAEKITSQFQHYREIKLLQSESDEIFEDFDLLIPVFHKERPLSYLLVGDINEDEIRVSPIIKHMSFIQTLTNVISVAIENKELISKSLEQERVKTELQLAAEMQALMVGSGIRNYPTFEVATYYKPHGQIGGDFCDFIALSDNEAFFCMADVSGKGVSAAFLMANVQAHMRALLEHTNWTLESIAKELNDKVMQTVKGDRFVTLFMGYFHRPSRTLHYVNAGHNPPILVQKQEISFLEKGTVGIGMLSELPFLEKGQVVLSRNAGVFCYTDGVVEIENESEEEFGNERLADLILSQNSEVAHVDDLISHVINAMDVHRGSKPYFDDTALLFCRFK